MKAIVDLSQEEYAEFNSVYKNLKDKINGVQFKDLMSVQMRYGYAHYKFSGEYSEKLVELLGRHPTNNEIIMLVDGGFSHFGASCSMNRETRTFGGRVNTD